MPEPIHILSENPIEQIWIHLAQYESKTLAKKLIAERAEAAEIALSPQTLETKAQGVAYCLRNAREYLMPTPVEWTKRVLVSYYGLMSFVSALLIANPANAHDLDALEGKTKQGHGINNFVDEALLFPESELAYLTGTGFLGAYFAEIGIAAAQFALTRNQVGNPQALSPGDRAKLISLDGLLARIPETVALYREVTGRAALSVNCFHSSTNMIERNEPGYNQGPEVNYTWVGLGAPLGMAEQELASLEMPLLELRVSDAYHHWEGKLPGAVEAQSWGVLDLYKSSMCGSSWVKPVFGTRDMIAVHFMLLYALSIVVRYRPKLWREITEGELDSYFALIKAYLAVFHRILPELALGRITGRQVRADQPGGFGGLV